MTSRHGGLRPARKAEEAWFSARARSSGNDPACAAAA
jgi:hypothetical protein